MSEQTVRLDSLPEPVAALLRAVHDALDIPLPGLTDADERAYTTLLARRVMEARVTLACILQDGHEVGWAAASLREQVKRGPVTYTPWTDGGGER
ncbi:hypothetical protein [Streptomyces sp. Ru72]|uniref:hypothetical protein n=1 Tax=Streptomyces sp. Ru72 TaxID=2080747 RepID=UPI000CDD4772|nr:hypothetical protein [Streptomyces sp. Ru72]POX54857.1 hypothetical protein C3488_00155 [Streptomyces sp. Ru72]